MGPFLWLLSVVVEWVPGIWVVPAIAGIALYAYGAVYPGKTAAALVQMISAGLVVGGASLLIYASATAAFEARVKAAVEAERARVAAIVGQSITDARTEAKAADEARIAAEARLADALARTPPDDPSKPKGGGLSPSATKALLSITEGK